MKTEEVLEELYKKLKKEKNQILSYLSGYQNACQDTKEDTDYQYVKGRRDGVKEAISIVREKLDEVKEDE